MADTDFTFVMIGNINFTLIINGNFCSGSIYLLGYHYLLSVSFSLSLCCPAEFLL